MSIFPTRCKVARYHGDDNHSSTEHLVLRMRCRHNGDTKFAIMVVGPDGAGRQRDGGPVVPGPWGALIPLPTVLSARPRSRPIEIAVADGDRFQISSLLGTVFEIRDDRPMHYPRLVAVDTVAVSDETRALCAEVSR